MNKPKETENGKQRKSSKKPDDTITRIQKAAAASVGDDVCRICHDFLDATEEEEECQQCYLLVHSSCLRGDGCPDCGDPRNVPGGF